MQLIVATIAAGLALTLLHAYAVEFARAAVLGWARIYTIGARHEMRTRRLAELRSDIAEQIVDERRQGVAYRDIAIRILVRAAIGIPGDLTWAIARTTSYWELSAALFVCISFVGSSLWFEQTLSTVLRGTTPSVFIVMELLNGTFYMSVVGNWGRFKKERAAGAARRRQLA